MEEKEPLQTSPQKISDLITEPLIAAITANNKMTLTQKDFMLDTCFTKDESGRYKPVTIEMSLNNAVMTPGLAENSEPIIQAMESRFSLPLLTIIPLNNFSVNEVTVNFDVEVLSVKDDDHNGSSELYGKVSGEKIAGKPIISFAIHANQIPLPVGVNIVIDAFSKNIQPITIS